MTKPTNHQPNKRFSSVINRSMDFQNLIMTHWPKLLQNSPNCVDASKIWFAATLKDVYWQAFFWCCVGIHQSLDHRLGMPCWVDIDKSRCNLDNFGCNRKTNFWSVATVWWERQYFSLSVHIHKYRPAKSNITNQPWLPTFASP